MGGWLNLQLNTAHTHMLAPQSASRLYLPSSPTFQILSLLQAYYGSTAKASDSANPSATTVGELTVTEFDVRWCQPYRTKLGQFDVLGFENHFI